jgi:hypothetical protein
MYVYTSVTKQKYTIMSYQIFEMIESAKKYGLIVHTDDAKLSWEEGKKLYENFKESEFDDVDEFLIKEEEELIYDTHLRSPEDELDLNIRALEASENGNMKLSNTIWSLIELKGYERLDYTMTLQEMVKKSYQ